ncbi:hypothetical protein A8E25_33845 [Burkholderia cenocepacia]|nr:hypothetical protein WQ49_34020 [Burkholderia cenocepacia]ONR54865.1 hypothetical protein A8E17_24840 [Burkholderia cenocepacia]ONR67978.1 hypothetical protein A8E23_20735 [Burkholderia cenocepacia]ONR71611.1 hypothetical protein A8E18_16410 [Burkholderia cenocepacia]ONR79730.1 hypothetical protein A8E18_01470 [Burkholderia cenocepacia]
MTDTSTESTSSTDFLGGHSALDALNTLQLIDGSLTDMWATDTDVETWMARHRLAADAQQRRFPERALVDTARELREATRKLVLARKSGNKLELRTINRMLASARRTSQILITEDGAPKIVERYEDRTPDEFLAPLTEAVSQLICDTDFSLVKKCENPDCMLWFLDRTKSHRRRWCSMALCGNRLKVAAFRRRHSS